MFGEKLTNLPLLQMDSILCQAPSIALLNCGRPTKGTSDSSFINDPNRAVHLLRYWSRLTHPQRWSNRCIGSLMRDVRCVTCIYSLALFLSIKVFWEGNVELISWLFYFFSWKQPIFAILAQRAAQRSTACIQRESLKGEPSIIIALSCICQKKRINLAHVLVFDLDPTRENLQLILRNSEKLRIIW